MHKSRILTSTSALLVILPLASLLLLLLPPVSGLKCIWCGEFGENAKTLKKNATKGAFTPEEKEIYLNPLPCKNFTNATDPRFVMDCDHYGKEMRPDVKKWVCTWYPKHYLDRPSRCGNAKYYKSKQANKMCDKGKYAFCTCKKDLCNRGRPGNESRVGSGSMSTSRSRSRSLDGASFGLAIIFLGIFFPLR